MDLSGREKILGALPGKDKCVSGWGSRCLEEGRGGVISIIGNTVISFFTFHPAEYTMVVFLVAILVVPLILGKFPFGGLDLLPWRR